MSGVRAFVAMELPEPVQDAILKQTQPMRRKLGDDLVRWIPPQNIHLTLKFLGEIDPSHVDFVKQMLMRDLNTQTEFDMQLSGLGSFPDHKRPRVIWIGIHAPAALVSLYRMIEEGCARLGYERENRPFSPHLTIGRVRQDLSKADLERINPVLESTQLGSIPTCGVNSIHLFKSDLKPAGAIYSKLYTQKLQPRRLDH